MPLQNVSVLETESSETPQSGQRLGWQDNKLEPITQHSKQLFRKAATKCKVYFTDLGAKITLHRKDRVRKPRRGLRNMAQPAPDLTEQLLVGDFQEDEMQQDVGMKEHLVYMVNGLFGNASNWLVVEEKLKQQLNNATTVFHKSEANQFSQTFDGVEICGERLCEEMKGVVSKYPNLQRISLIGHSMGGLFLRFAIGKLYDVQAKTVCGLHPCHFITMVTPHLGSDAEGPAQVPFLSWPGMVPGVGGQLHNVFSYFAAPVTQQLYKRSGLQLFLDDDQEDPMLLKLTRDLPEQGCYFWSALCSFQTRTCLANAGSDHIVGWPNASIRDIHELPDIDFEGKVCKGVVREDPIEIAFDEEQRSKVKQLTQELNLDQYSARVAECRDGEEGEEQPPLEVQIEAGAMSPASFYSADSYIELIEEQYFQHDGQQQQQQVGRVQSPLGSHGLEEIDFQFNALNDGNYEVSTHQTHVYEPVDTDFSFDTVKVNSNDVSHSNDNSQDHTVSQTQFITESVNHDSKSSDCGTTDNQDNAQDVKKDQSSQVQQQQYQHLQQETLYNKVVVSQSDEVGTDTNKQESQQQQVLKQQQQQYFQTPAERMEKSRKILDQLKKLNWRRIDVSFRDARMKFFSHQLIQVTRRWINWEGEGVPEYLAVEFKKMEELVSALQ